MGDRINDRGIGIVDNVFVIQLQLKSRMLKEQYIAILKNLVMTVVFLDTWFFFKTNLPTILRPISAYQARQTYHNSYGRTYSLVRAFVYT